MRAELMNMGVLDFDELRDRAAIALDLTSGNPKDWGLYAELIQSDRELVAAWLDGAKGNIKEVRKAIRHLFAAAYGDPEGLSP